MIAKKNSGVDLEKKRFAFLGMGFLLTSTLLLAAFTYEEPVMRDKEKYDVASSEIDYQIDYQQKEPPKVQRQQPVQSNQNNDNQNQNVGSSNAISERSQSTSNTNNVSTGISSLLPPGTDFPVDDIGDIGGGEVVEIPLIDAKFVGGYKAMVKHINEVMKYPQESIEMGEQGRVYLSFIVEKDGSLTNIEVSREAYPSLDREAKRIVRSFPKWIPGEDAYGKVRTRVSLPINFILED